MKLKDILKKKTVIVGIGNTMKGDDGFGPALIRRLKGKIKMPCIDAGNTPENYVSVIARERPRVVLLADCADVGSEPGRYEILNSKEVLKSGFTTHDISAGMFIEYLKNRTKAEIYMLGVQPENISFGSAMSDKVKRTLEEVASIIKCTKHI